MASIPADLQRKEAARLRVLKAVYEIADGDPQVSTALPVVMERAGLDHGEGDVAFRYLCSEGLLQGQASDRVAITHQGVKAYEAALKAEATKGTDHFAAPVIVQVVHANVAQTLGVPSGDVVELTARLLAKAREHGDEDAIALAEKAHAHAQAGTLGKVRVYMESLKAFLELTPLVGAIAKALAGVGM